MTTASVPALSPFLLQLPWVVDCDKDTVTDQSPFLPKLLLAMVFVTATETKQGQIKSFPFLST